MPIKFDVQVDDPTRSLDDHDGIKANVQAAGQLWASRIDSDVTISVIVQPSCTEERVSGRSCTNEPDGRDEHWGLCRVIDCVPYAIRHRKQPARGARLLIELNPEYMKREIWLDSNPCTRSATVPSDRIDGVSLFLHELAHGMGMNGFLDCRTGRPRTTVVSTYDQHVRFENERFWFHGEAARSVYGGAVPLTQPPNNNYHHVECIKDLMNGIEFCSGHRYEISDLDLAILKDVGLPI